MYVSVELRGVSLMFRNSSDRDSGYSDRGGGRSRLFTACFFTSCLNSFFPVNKSPLAMSISNSDLV